MSTRKNFSSLLNASSSSTPQSARKREETKEYQEFLASRAAKAKQKQKGNAATSAQQTPKKRSTAISSITVTPSNNKIANTMLLSSQSKDTKVAVKENVASTPAVSTPMRTKVAETKKDTKTDGGVGGTSLEDKIAASLATPISSFPSSNPQDNDNNNNRSYPTSPPASTEMGLSREEKERYEEELEQKVKEAELQVAELKQLREHITKLSLQLEEKDSAIILKSQQLSQAQEETLKAVQEKALSKEEVDTQLTRLLDSKAVGMSAPSSSFFSQKVISWLHRSGYGGEERDYEEDEYDGGESRSRASSMRLSTGGTHVPEYAVDMQRRSGRFESALDDKISSVIAAEKEAGVKESADTEDDKDDSGDSDGDGEEEEEEEDDDDDLDITASVVHVGTVSAGTPQSVSEVDIEDGNMQVNAGELATVDEREDMEEALQEWEAQVGLRDGKSKDKVEKHVSINESKGETDVDTDVDTEIETDQAKVEHGDAAEIEEAPQEDKKTIRHHSYKQNKLLQGGNDSSFFHSDNASDDNDSDSDGSVDSAFGASGIDVNTLVTHKGDPMEKFKTIAAKNAFADENDSGEEDNDDHAETFMEKQFIPQHPGSQNLIMASDLYVILLQEILQLRAELHTSA